MLKPILSLCVTVLMVAFVTACNSNSSSDGETKGSFPTMGAQSISRNGCLNLAVIQERLSSGSYPAVEVTTDFQPDPSLNPRKNLFHTYSAFDVREITTSDIAPLLAPVQSDCSEVQAHTISGETLTYKVASTSDNSITVELVKPKGNDQISEYRLKALQKKMQPTKIKVDILSATALRVTTTYRGFDAHCRGSKPLVSTIQKDYMWAMNQNMVPKEVAIRDSFYQKVVSALKSPTDSTYTPEPAPEPEAEPQPEPFVPSPTDPTIPVSPNDPTTPTIPGLPGTAEAPVLPSPVSFVVANEVNTSSDYRTVSLGELRTIETKQAKDEYVRCAH